MSKKKIRGPVLRTLGATTMKFKYELTKELAVRAQSLEEFANGAAKVSVALKDGR